MQQNPHPRACTGVTELCLLKSKSNSLPTETTSQSKGKQLQKRMNRLQHIDQISQAAKMIRRQISISETVLLARHIRQSKLNSYCLVSRGSQYVNVKYRTDGEEKMLGDETACFIHKIGNFTGMFISRCFSCSSSLIIITYLFTVHLSVISRLS